jgi:hypothetical protein
MGHSYVSRYLVVGDKFYDQDMTLFAYRVLPLPEVSADALSFTHLSLPPADRLGQVDGSGAWVLEASIEVVDGNNPELKDRATRQLMALKETLRPSLALVVGDRLALDTRVPLASRR